MSHAVATPLTVSLATGRSVSDPLTNTFAGCEGDTEGGSVCELAKGSVFGP